MMSAPETTVRASDISFRYGDQDFINNLYFHARSGELTALVGPNGCGKSTLLKVLSRVLPMSRGSVQIIDSDVKTTPTKLVSKKLALLPQGPIAPEGLTVQELVAQGRFPHQSLLRQWSEDDERAVKCALNQTSLMDFQDRPVSELSGGQRQRCWIAMVLAQETPVLFLDEPTTFLDLKVQVDIMALLQKIAHCEQRTVVVAIHDLNVAAAYADRMVMMREGRILFDGPVQEVYMADNLDQVFDLKVTIMTDPVSNRPVCVPITTRFSTAAE